MVAAAREDESVPSNGPAAAGTGGAQPGSPRGWPAEYAARYGLSNELHARPFDELTAPIDLTLYAMLTGEETAAEDRAHLESLCQRFGVNPPAAEANFFSADFGPFRLRWERHSEFTTYTVIRPRDTGEPFTRTAGDKLPRDWTGAMPGALLAAVQVVLLARDDPDPDMDQLHRLFVRESLVTSLLSDGAAQLWTDLRIHPDGMDRLLLKDRHMHAARAGRVVQRLLETITYRNLALLALPLARGTSPKIVRIDRALAEITEQMARRGHAPETDDGALLERLTAESAEIERLASATAYRFSAAMAYNALVEARLAELREERIEGYQTLGEFLDRRLAPAMRTCASVSDRLADLSRRATRAANLLRTRVDFALERQNQGLLHSMDRRAKLQLRLQQPVEGLSVAAISYYLVGLVNYGAKAVATAGLALDPTLVTGLAIPAVVAVVWAGLRRARRAIARTERGDREAAGGGRN